MGQEQIYDESFFEMCRQTNYPSAKCIVPLVKQFIEPKSVIDFGCGVGCWLKAFDEECTLDVMLGLDGEWLRGQRLFISESCVSYVDLSKEYHSERDEKYDLAVSLEVAEHISYQYMDIYLDNIVKSSDVVLFSAAIPQQGGTGHVNERWQSYWVDRFSERKFLCIDAIRPLCWDNEDAGIYRQNIFLFVKETEVVRYPKLKAWLGKKAFCITDVVHPMLYSEHKVARKFIEQNNLNMELASKNKELFSIMAEWMSKEIAGRRLAEWLRRYQVDELAIYGIGEMGKVVLKYLKASGFVVRYGIDRAVGGSVDDTLIYHMRRNTDLPWVSWIIVTVPHDFKSICDELNLRFEHVNILNFAEIVHDM